MMRKTLSAEGLYKLVSFHIKKIPDARQQRATTISLVDACMSALGMFSLKYPSLLQFEKATMEEANVRHNLKTLYQVEEIPKDTTMREIIDVVETAQIQALFKPVLAEIQRGKLFERYVFYKKKYLLSIDGTGFFNSNEIHCPSCCVKEHQDKSKTYYHQMLSGVLVHPENKEVIPFGSEPISNQDGKKKNDCERTACERFLRRIRREHPHMGFIIVEDGLASNAPHVRLLKELNMSFILGCKSGDHGFLFDFIEQSEKLGEVKHRTIKQQGKTHRFRYMNHVPINDANSDLFVHFIEYWETNAKGKTQHFSWISDEVINEDNMMSIMRGGRARWKIENETFNTLKNAGYQFEHNFGHGNKNLSDNFAILMMLVFLIDQVQQISCDLFQRALKKTGRISYLWKKMQQHFIMLSFNSWQEFFDSIILKIKVSYTIDTG